MRTLWRLGSATAGEIIADLAGRMDWQPKTVQTLIRRLVQKGAVEFGQSGRERVYRPAVEERECELQASQSFLDRVFDGQLAPFLANFAARRGDLSEADLAELRKLLEGPSHE